MSGRRATIGGSMSHGAVTFGSGRHGTSASAALGFEIVPADGRVLRTGSGSQAGHDDFLRGYGPDLTGLFTGDCGALGIKTAVTLRLERRPAFGDGVSFVFRSFESLHAAVTKVAHHGLATEVFGAETSLLRAVGAASDRRQDLRTLLALARAQPSAWRGARQALRSALGLALRELRAVLVPHGREVANTMAAVVRAMPFPDPMVLGPAGKRLLPLHAILPWSRATEFHASLRRLLREREAELAGSGVEVYTVYSTVADRGFLYEPVIYWIDEWPELHRRTLPAELLEALGPPPAPASEATRACVERLRLAIVGAGIGGLSAALALHRAGLRPRVYEQADAIGEVGAGISLSPNAVKGLRYLGVGSALDAAADEPPQQVTRHFATGETLIRIDRADTVARYGAPYYQTHRADLYAALLDALRAQDTGALVTTHRANAVEDIGGAVTVCFDNGEHVIVDALIGADGLKSRVRECVMRAEAPPFSGYVAFARTGRWEAESWSQLGSIEEVLGHFAGWHEEVNAIITATPAGRCHKWGLFARAPLERWVGGCVALLGDAAHPMMPWFGQGAACAIEDAVILGRCFSAAPDVGEALRRYEAARRKRVTLIHRESLAGGERLAAANPEALRGQPVRNEDTLGLFSYDPAAVPV
jgi:salicylate hydroxylase